jgi:hypothetical protein
MTNRNGITTVDDQFNVVASFAQGGVIVIVEGIIEEEYGNGLNGSASDL